MTLSFFLPLRPELRIFSYLKNINRSQQIQVCDPRIGTVVAQSEGKKRRLCGFSTTFILCTFGVDAAVDAPGSSDCWKSYGKNTIQDLQYKAHLKYRIVIY